MLEQRIGELKAIIAENDGRNAADRRFSRAVDDLISAFYDDIGQITGTPSRALFDLFVIKVLYVRRGSCHADVIEYLGAMLETFLYARELFPPDGDGEPGNIYFSDVLDDERRAQTVDSRFEAYRGYGDRALFLTGVFRSGTQRQRPSHLTALRRRSATGVDDSYYVNTGRTMYRMASREHEAAEQRQRETLERLAKFFDVYVEALNELSARYILGFDLDMLADKLLDRFNDFRHTHDGRALTDARRYAAILQLDTERFPALFDKTA